MIALALTFVGAIGVSAQSWTAVSVQAGKFNLYNVGTSQFFTRGNGWGTQASITADGKQSSGMTLEFTAAGTNWFLSSKPEYNNNYGIEHLSGGTVYTDQSRNKQSTWTFAQVGSNEHGPIYTILSADNHGGGSGFYLVAEGGSSTIVAPMSDGSSANAQWQVVKAKTDQDYIDEANAAKSAALSAMASASPSNPVNATALIFNANFDTKALQSYWVMQSSNYNPQGGAASNPNAESWRAAFTLTQKITGLPEGTYVLEAQAAITDYAGTGNDWAVVYGNEVTSTLKEMINGENSMTMMSNSFSNGLYDVDPLTIIVGDDGELTVGVRGTRNDTWCVWDNFRLTFYGFDLAALVNAYHNSLAAAQSVEGKMSAQSEADLATAVSTYSSIDESDKNAVRAAKTALDNAVIAAEQSVKEYKQIAAFLEDYASAPGINQLKQKYEAGAFTTMADFYPEFQTTVTSTLGTRDGVDISAIILNNCPTTNNDFWNGNVSNAFDPGNNVAEFWNMSGAYMSQTLPQLPEGTYFLTVKAFTRTGYNATLSTSTGASINLVTVENTVVNNRTQAKEWFDGGNGDNLLAFNIVGAPQDVTITLKADDANGDHWMVWRNFRLEYNTLKELTIVNIGNPVMQLADGTVINNGDTKTANANQIKDGIIINFPGTLIKNVPIHPSHFQAKGKIENKTDGVTYIVRSNGYFDNGYNPNFDIHFGWGLFGWSNSALEEYIAAVGFDSYREDETRKAKRYNVTVNEILFIDTEMDAVDMKKGYEVNVIGMSHPGTYTPGTYAVPDTKDMTAEDFMNSTTNKEYIYELFVYYFNQKWGRDPVVEYEDIDALLEMQRYYLGWENHDGNGKMDGPKGDDAPRPYRPLTADEIEYIRFFMATFCEGVILWRDNAAPYNFTIRTTSGVQQDPEKITRDQVVTAWDVKGNQVTDLLFEPAVETSIEGIEAASEDNAIYNLAGQRVQTARKGIFVVGGKKVVLM